MRRRWRALVAGGVALLCLYLASALQAFTLVPPLFSDAKEPSAGAADLVSVRFGQQAERVQFRVALAHDWSTDELEPKGRRHLCVELTAARDRGRAVCVVRGGDGRPALTIGPAATAATNPSIAAALVGRPDDRVVFATFPPQGANLPAGDHMWRVVSEVRGVDACAGGVCQDVVPTSGAEAMRTALLVQPRCFGASSRAPGATGCPNPALRTTVVPKPGDALLLPNAPCVRGQRRGGVEPCTFGLPAAIGRSQFALVGDSHAAQWRGAAEVAAFAGDAHGVSFTKSGCPFTVRPTNLSPAGNVSCARFVRGVRAWLGAHPEVTTVLVASHALPDSVERQAAYRSTWSGFPKSVKRILVIRDTPVIAGPQAACVERAIAKRLPAGVRCAQRRSDNVRVDPEALAARAPGVDSRVHLLDLTRYFCGETVCLPVVGGVLVRKDGEHMTPTFSATLGPYLRAAMR